MMVFMIGFAIVLMKWWLQRMLFLRRGQKIRQGSEKEPEKKRKGKGKKEKEERIHDHEKPKKVKPIFE